MLIRIALRHTRDLILFKLDQQFGHAIEKYIFQKKHGYWLNLEQPESFSEKIIWKKINDRNPLLPITSDKYMVRFYVEAILGYAKAAEILVPLLYCTDDPESIPFNKLTSEYIVKANHSSGRTIIVENNYSPAQIKAKCRRFLAGTYGLAKNEKAYSQIKRMIVIEKLLKDESGAIPKDYKYFVFNGKCRFIQAIDNRFGQGGTLISFYNPEWEKLDVNFCNERTLVIKKPDKHEEMIKLAESLGKHFDFVRVDLYNIKDKIYFGELTHYPNSGRRRFDPVGYDFIFGRYWNLEEEYWEKDKNKDKILDLAEKVKSLASQSRVE